MTIGLPVALFSFIMNNDSNPTVQMVAWAAQIWMFVYLCVLGPVPHFLEEEHDEIMEELHARDMGEEEE